MKSAIAFATLFLGLTLGPHSVEVLVGHAVRSVEILLDGEPVASLDGPPWKTTCNLGQELAPRRLQAIAYGQEGEELGRTTQWLNIPRAPAQGRIHLDTDPETGRVTARLRSTSITQETPERVSVHFDGQPLPAADIDRIELPEHDPKALHYLRVDFEFEDGFNTTVERTFGGTFAEQIGAELTAVPLDFDKSAAKLGTLPDDLLQAHGEGLSIVDVVEGPAEIVLVRDQSVQADIDRMVRRRPGDLRGVGSLKKGYSLTLLRPFAERLSRSDTDLRLFRPTARLTPFDGGVFWLMAVVRAPRAPARLQRLSDALAVAGLTVAADGHRRAVVLVVGSDPQDNSQYSPETVRGYLEKMRVPLFIWSTAGETETPWGPASDASSMNRIGRLTKQLVKSLERQRIAWVRGVYLPPDITLNSSGSGIRLAGS